MSAVELTIRNDTFALGADIDEDLVAIDADDCAFDDVTVLEAADVGVLLGEKLLHGGGLRPVPHDNRSLVRFFGGRRVGDLFFGNRCYLKSGRRVDDLFFGNGFYLESGRGGRLADLGFFGDGGLGGLVGYCNAGGLLGRLFSDRGRCLGLRRGPARKLFGQDLSPMVDSRPQKQTARATLKPSNRSAVPGLRALGPLLR